MSYADPNERMTLETVAEHSWLVGDDGPIPHYVCWCKRKGLQEESESNNTRITCTDKI